MVNEKISIGFVGCGRVADNHYRAVKKCSSAQLIAVSDIDEKLGQQKADKWGALFCSPDEIINIPDINAIFILTPMEVHYKYTQKALSQGKHVLVEKPVSMNINEIENMETLSQRFGKICMPGHSYLYLPELTRMKKLISQNEIGTPTMMFMSEIYFMPQEFVKKYHGPLQEVLCHQIYLMLAFMGIPNRVQAFTGCFRKKEIPTGDEQVIVNVEFSNGALAQLFVSWAGEDETSDPWTFKIKVLGTNGGLHFSRKDVVNKIKDEKPPWNYPLYDEMFEREVDYFINKCIIQGKKPISTLKDALTTLYILNAIKTSICEGTVKDINLK